MISFNYNSPVNIGAFHTFSLIHANEAISCHWVDSTLINLRNLFNMIYASQHP